MNAGDRGFLLLTGALGDPERKPLTVAQFRTLAARAGRMEKPDSGRELTPEDLLALGYDRASAARIVALLEQEQLLDRYLRRGERMDCVPITRADDRYPGAVRQRLGLDAPGCLWAKGDLSIINTPAVSLVGSRDMAEHNRDFAQQAGAAAAEQGITLVSGNARGADREAQEACLEKGGRVISVVPDQLQKYPVRKQVLYLSEDGFDVPFSPQRALSRNRVIHAMGALVLIAQAELGVGGTWDGTGKNLRYGWSPVFCFDDGGAAARELEQMGAVLIGQSQLSDFSALQGSIRSFL